MSIYTKTSLKSVKKGDLVEMYLELQGKYNDVQMDDDENANEKLTKNKYDKFKCEKCKGHHTGCPNPTCDTCVEELKEDLRKHKVAYIGASTERNEVKKENEKIKKTLIKLMDDNDILREKWIKSRAYGMKLEKENDKLKEEIDGDIWGINEGLKKEKINLITQHKGMVKEIGPLRRENDKLKEEVKELTKYCEISTIIADMECEYLYEYAEITDAERLCELGWADKDDFACLR
jgi:hypothetical protein